MDCKYVLTYFACTHITTHTPPNMQELKKHWFGQTSESRHEIHWPFISTFTDDVARWNYWEIIKGHLHGLYESLNLQSHWNIYSMREGVISVVIWSRTLTWVSKTSFHCKCTCALEFTELFIRVLNIPKHTGWKAQTSISTWTVSPRPRGLSLDTQLISDPSVCMDIQTQNIPEHKILKKDVQCDRAWYLREFQGVKH